MHNSCPFSFSNFSLYTKIMIIYFDEFKYDLKYVKNNKKKCKASHHTFIYHLMNLPK